MSDRADELLRRVVIEWDSPDYKGMRLQTVNEIRAYLSENQPEVVTIRYQNVDGLEVAWINERKCVPEDRSVAQINDAGRRETQPIAMTGDVKNDPEASGLNSARESRDRSRRETASADPASPHQPIAATPLPVAGVSSQEDACGAAATPVQQTAQPVKVRALRVLERSELPATLGLWFDEQGNYYRLAEAPLYTAPAVQPPHTHRWNVEESDGGEIRICRGGHQSSERCEWEYFVPKSAAVQPIPRDPTQAMMEAGWKAYYATPTPRMIGPIWIAMHDAFTKGSGGE